MDIKVRVLNREAEQPADPAEPQKPASILTKDYTRALNRDIAYRISQTELSRAGSTAIATETIID